jgi:hypothetical protein
MPELHGSFATLIERPDTHVVFDLAPESNTLLVLFGGIAGGVSIPVFEFFRVTDGYPSKRVFLRDPRRSWYQLGIPGVGDSASGVRSLLVSTIARSGAERVVMAGASAGGYAAMLFGTWCGADETIAFSPQTFIDPVNRELSGDGRWQAQIDALHDAVDGRDAVLDLLEVLPSIVSQTRHQIHVSTDDNLDMIHAQRMAGCPGVEIIQHVDGGHRLVKTLRDRGILKPLMLRALAANNQAGEPGTRPPEP